MATGNGEIHMKVTNMNTDSNNNDEVKNVNSNCATPSERLCLKFLILINIINVNWQ